MKAKKLFSVALDFLFPPRCVFCHSVISPSMRICAKCADDISRINAVKCIYVPPAGETILCTSPYLYQDKIRESVIRFKFYGQKDLSGFYAEKMADLIKQSYSDLHFDIVTSVPISGERYRLRGYNQSELLAKAVAICLNLPYGECLIKIKDNKEQHKLSEKERHNNVRGVYRHKSLNSIAGKNILLIDDIVTTGATLGECAAVLFRGGAKQVACAAIAQVML